MNQKGLYPMVRYNLRIDSVLMAELHALAENDRRQLSDYIRLVLEDHVKTEFQKAGIARLTRKQVKDKADFAVCVHSEE